MQATYNIIFAIEKLLPNLNAICYKIEYLPTTVRLKGKIKYCKLANLKSLLISLKKTQA